MQDLSPEGREIVADLARRHGVGAEAVATLLRAVARGNGVQAQFNHPDLGGMGQWSQGGMIMIGDMFNQGLKHRVDQLCSELAALWRSQPLFAAPAASRSRAQGAAGGASLFVQGSGAGSEAWWPAELGAPASTGAQNDLRYAFFPAARRLAIQLGSRLSVYDSGDHDITGFSQQQGGDQSLTFTSQHGLVRVADLPLVAPGFVDADAGGRPDAGERPSSHEVASAPPAQARASADDIFAMIERLAELRQKNILTEEEYAAKKAELLSRI